MDPNQTLRDLRALVEKVLRDCEKSDGTGADQDDAHALAEKFLGLDDWLSGKGFLPQDWQARPIRSRAQSGRRRGGR